MNQSKQQKIPKTVLTAEFKHETNSFCISPTTQNDFVERFLLYGEEAIAARGDANTELAGFLECQQLFAWRLIHVLSTSAQPSGMLTRDTFELFASQIVQAVRDHRHELDGVLLGLHGAMVAEGVDDGEGELLRRVRFALEGEEDSPSSLAPAPATPRYCPIAITLDLHANCSVAMAELADIIVSYKTYPHVDMRVAGVHAGTVLDAAMHRRIKPRTIRAYRPMLEVMVM